MGQKDVSKGYIQKETLAYVGSHRHSPNGNDPYIYTYIYKYCIKLPEKANMLVLPKNENIAVFAITLSDNYIDDISFANEIRALP